MIPNIMKEPNFVREEISRVCEFLREEGHKVLALNSNLDFENYIDNYCDFLEENYYKKTAFHFFDKSTSYWKCKLGPLFVPISEQDIRNEYTKETVNPNFDLEETIGWIKDDLEDTNGHLSTNLDYYCNRLYDGNFILPEHTEFNILIFIDDSYWFCDEKYLNRLIESLKGNKNLNILEGKIINNVG